jgi:hypothetical protein
MRIAGRPPKPKFEKPVKPTPRAKDGIPFTESDLSIVARRAGVALKPGRPRSPVGESIEGPRGCIYEGWNKFAMWLYQPSVDDEKEFVDFLLTGGATPLSVYPEEIEKCIQDALAAGLEQHDRPDHAHFFRWDSKDDQKTAVALKLIGVLRDSRDFPRSEPPQVPDFEILTAPQRARNYRKDGRNGKSATRSRKRSCSARPLNSPS